MDSSFAIHHRTFIHHSSFIIKKIIIHHLSMTLPKGDEYHQAVQTPALSFADAELKSAEVETTVLGLPKPYSGGFTTTYRMIGVQNWAVRCFTRELKDLQQRYQSIGRFLNKYRCPFLVNALYLENGIRVNGTYYPVIKMDWLEGDSLHDYVEKIVFQKDTLKNLSFVFNDLINSLESFGIAHGDLQHSNILVQNGRLYLIDYDGMYLPDLSNLVAHELGHPNFQHPKRTMYDYGPDMDRFSAIVIYSAIQALMIAPALWKKYDNGENLLFKASDFAAPQRSPLLRDMEKYPELTQLVKNIRMICTVPTQQVPSMEAFRMNNFAVSAPARPAETMLQTNDLVLDGMLPSRLMTHLGKKVNVVGRIWNAEIADNQSFVFLNISDKAESSLQFRVMILPTEIAELKTRGITIHSNGLSKDGSRYEYQWISVRGNMGAYKGSPQMLLENANDIEIYHDTMAARSLITPSQITTDVDFWDHYLSNPPAQTVDNQLVDPYQDEPERTWLHQRLSNISNVSDDQALLHQGLAVFCLVGGITLTTWTGWVFFAWFGLVVCVKAVRDKMD
jgi:serine/threonine protein kinase